jgi:hypothetical protein
MMQIISNLADHCEDADCALGLAYLGAVTTCGRFDLNLKFFSKSEKGIISTFLDKIVVALSDPANHTSIFGEDFTPENVEAIRAKWQLPAN